MSTSDPSPLPPRTAIEKATGYLTSILPLETTEISLEELEIKGDAWNVTFSMPDKNSPNFSILPIIPRKFKTVKIHFATGDFIALLMRDPPSR